jgi:ubiquinone/menaquinone biosynthesis C-methylase UbiE
MTTQADASFKQRDAGSYDHVAGQYDAFITRFSGPLVERLIALAGIAPGSRVLDVGTGPGIVALAAAPLVGDRGHVMGVDLSEGMLVAAREKAARHPHGAHVEFRQMDAEHLAVPDASFDVVVSLFALHHFPNPAAALAEMYRVLRPGGVLCIGVGSGPSRRTWVGLVDAAVQVRDLLRRKRGRLLRAPQFLTELVERHCPAPDAEELTEMASSGWKDPGTVPRLVARAGFDDVRTDWLGQRRVIDSVQDFWNLQRIYSSTARKRLSVASPERVAAVHADFVARCATVQHGGGELVYSYASLYVIGRRPLSAKQAS